MIIPRIPRTPRASTRRLSCGDVSSLHPRPRWSLLWTNFYDLPCTFGFTRSRLLYFPFSFLARPLLHATYHSIDE